MSCKVTAAPTRQSVTRNLVLRVFPVSNMAGMRRERAGRGRDTVTASTAPFWWGSQEGESVRFSAYSSSFNSSTARLGSSWGVRCQVPGA